MGVEDTWNHASRNPSPLRWRARWRDAQGRQRSKAFRTEKAAKRHWLRMVTEPEDVASDVTVDELCQRLTQSKSHLSKATRDMYANGARHVLAEFTGWQAGEVKPSDVRVWVAGIEGSGSLRQQCLQTLHQAMEFAVTDEALKANPCDKISVRRGPTREPRFLSVAELEKLAGEIDAALVWLMGTTGLRIGEVGSLRVGSFHAARSRIRVAAVDTKTRKGRDVPVPAKVAAMLPVDDRGLGEWLFPAPGGGRMETHNWRRRVWAPAVKRAGLEGVRPHDLRHTAASLAIRSGADVKQVQAMLGHRTATMTLDLYGHLWPGGLDDVAHRMDGLL